MPRLVDHEARRQRIVLAAFDLFSEGGYGAISIRNVAKRLGGSPTLVTHYYPTRDAILDGMFSEILKDWERDAEYIDAQEGSQSDRLHAYLLRVLPSDASSFQREFLRIRLVAERSVQPISTSFLLQFDVAMRAHLRRRLDGLVPSARVEEGVGFLRVFITGVIILAVEHQDQWPIERQVQAVDHALALLGVETQLEGRH